MHSQSWSLKAAILQSWLGLAASIAFLVLQTMTTDNDLMAGGAILIAAVMSMNGWSRTDLALKREGDHWWHKHPILKSLHFVTAEGELSGILVGLVAVAGMLINGHSEEVVHTLHHSYAMGFTLLGIMAAARFAVPHMLPIMDTLEGWFGTRAAIALGSFLSSLTGEPAAAVFLTEFVLKRVEDRHRVHVAVGLAASIGSGGGLMPYAAPPVLIVWGVLSTQFGWGIGDLIVNVGVGCILHVILVGFWFVKYLKKVDNPKKIPLSFEAFLSLGWLGILIWSHVSAPGLWLWIADALTGAAATIYARRGTYEDHEERFTALWQHWILAILLLALEVIGLQVDPLISAIVAQIPTSMPLWTLALILFWATAWVSKFADNALASRIFIGVSVAMIPTVGLALASKLAAAIVMGALFGGYFTVPGNLPNFPIKRGLKVNEVDWIRRAVIMYPAIVAYVAWIVISFHI